MKIILLFLAALASFTVHAQPPWICPYI
ncbi:hypothetical protein, partial [Escherichia coli]